MSKEQIDPPTIQVSSKSTIFKKNNSKRFYIQLTNTPEIDFKDLVASHSSNSNSNTSSIVESNKSTKEETEANQKGNELNQNTKALKFPSTNRYNIIERLERRYGTGSIPDSEVNQDFSSINYDKKENIEDYYDSEDSFIDDTELHQTIEDQKEGNRIKTKHTGFFVNAGKQIETIYDSTYQSPSKEKHKRIKIQTNGSGSKNSPNQYKNDLKQHSKKKTIDDTSRSVKTFLQDWGNAAAEWQPGNEVWEKLNLLKQAANEFFKLKSPGKIFPRVLDNHLREVDKLVVDLHPNKWRVNGYFATLMQFLPFTKATLKSSMTRLELRDAALEARNKYDEAWTHLEELVESMKDKLRQSIENLDSSLKTELDTTFTYPVYDVISLQEIWCNQENEYRQILKPVDKMKLDSTEVSLFSIQRERNRLYNQMVELFPENSYDVTRLRLLYKNGRRRKRSSNSSSEKHLQIKKKKENSSNKSVKIKLNDKKASSASASGSASGSGSGSTSTTPSKSSNVSIKDANVSTKKSPTTTKQKLHRSRRFIICPTFQADDFEFDEAIIIDSA